MTQRFFADPAPPTCVYFHRHSHEWVEVGANQNPNGTWSSLWACLVCPDIWIGGHVGPVPPGYCERCGWVQRKPGRRKCEECKAELNQPITTGEPS